MKNIFGYLIFLVVLIMLIYFLAQPNVTHENIDGHEYIKVRGYYSVDIEHSENCWCKKNK